MARAITLDGPAGSGKSTTAKRVSAKLGIEMVPTSLWYRGYSEALRREGRLPQDLSTDVLEAWVTENKDRFQLVGQAMLMDGEDITVECRGIASNSPSASFIASQEQVRGVVNTATVDAVRFSPLPFMISEGRNEYVLHSRAGTLALGFYMTAPTEIRAIRRLAENPDQDLSEVELGIAKRDLADKSRNCEPLSISRETRIVRSADDYPSPTDGQQYLVDTAQFEGDEPAQDKLLATGIERLAA